MALRELESAMASETETAVGNKTINYEAVSTAATLEFWQAPNIFRITWSNSDFSVKSVRAWNKLCCVLTKVCSECDIRLFFSNSIN